MPDIIWKVSEEQATHILRVLGREPHDEVAVLHLSLRMQWGQQVKEKEARTPPKVVEPANSE